MEADVSSSKTGMVPSSVISRKPRSVRLGHHIITMQQSEDNGTERAVLRENSFKDEFDKNIDKDSGDRSAHADQPQIISDALCSQEINDIKHSSMSCLQNA